MNFKRISQRLFYNILEDHRTPTNIDINERLWTGSSEQMEEVWGLYVGIGFYI